MVSPSIDEKVAFLSLPGAYPNGVRSVETKKTHMSWVFLTETHAWKLKKPVRNDYLDFSSLEARRNDCEQEVVLNRRLAANVYLGVVPLTITAGSLMIAGTGQPVDWLVQMRRLPGDRMLDQTIADHTWTDEGIRKVGRLLGGFYKISSSAENSGARYRKRLLEEFQSSCLELRRREFELPAQLMDPICAEGMEFIEQNTKLFDDRVGTGRIVDGHGDLRAEHVCLEPQPVVIDCLEFNSSLRVVDSASELSFLKLECERLGAIEVGDRIMESYSIETGDWPPQQILQFYRKYHACIRAKLALWHLRDVPDNPSNWTERAKTYLHLAMRD